MSKVTLVGLGYRMRSGKDTAADVLVRDFNFHRMAFADPLKEAAKIIFGWGDEHVHGQLKEVVDPFWGFSPRSALQRLGTERVRDVFGPDTWAKATERRIQEMLPRPVVLTDVRFPQEAALVKILGGELWCIDRPGLPGASHASETAMADFQGWDRVIVNDKSLGEFQHRVRNAAFHGGHGTVPIGWLG